MRSNASTSSEEKKPHRLWSEKETRKLAKLLGEKTPMDRILQKLGRSEKSVRRKCENMGISSATVYNLSGTKSPQTR